jgi:xylulose-5-phosphate/fructose-6-phosphate phosphoketolase
MDAAVVHCTEGIGIWSWASNDEGVEPDVVLACCGDTPTLEILASASILREHLPELKVRVVNVVDLMKLQSASEHPHGLRLITTRSSPPTRTSSSVSTATRG